MGVKRDALVDYIDIFPPIPFFGSSPIFSWLARPITLGSCDNFFDIVNDFLFLTCSSADSKLVMGQYP